MALLIGALGAPFALRAQAPSPFTTLPMCTAPPSPETDGWPVAVADSLGSTPSLPLTFSSAALLANDIGTSLSVTSIGPGSHGGVITGTDPFTYFPPVPFLGGETFAYEVTDAAGETSIGLVRVSVTADLTPPSVSITAPVGTVSGNVMIIASASDNVGVANVTFLDFASQIGQPVLAAPFQTMWDTTLAGDGIHLLSAVAYDLAGNVTQSAWAMVTVNNSVTVTVPSVVGMTQSAAQAAITGATLSVGAVTTANSNTVASGLVMSQSPAGGTSVAPNSAVAFTVSLGPALVTVPSVVGMTQSAAEATITGAGLSVGAVTTASSATIPAGNVISQNPVGGASVVAGSAVALTVSSGPASSAAGLVAAFGFEEASGTTALNSVSASPNGTIRQALRTGGKIGRALWFDGSNDWVTVTDTTASPLDLTTGMTLEAWVNPDVMSGWATVMMKERGAAGNNLLAYVLYAHDGAPLFSNGTTKPAGYVRLSPAASTADVGVRGTAAIPLGVWTHLATTFDGTNQRFYVNGVLVGTTLNPGSIVVGNGALRIGGNASSGEFFQGFIDEVRVYNRALSAAEIGADMVTPIVR